MYLHMYLETLREGRSGVETSGKRIRAVRCETSWLRDWNYFRTHFRRTPAIAARLVASKSADRGSGTVDACPTTMNWPPVSVAIGMSFRSGQLKVDTPFGKLALPENPSLWAGFVLMGEP